MNFLDLKLLYRDWRGGQLNLVVSALIMAVTVVTAVSLFADRVERGIVQQISSFLAADLAVHGNIQIDESYIQAADRFELEQAQTTSFRSMVFVADKNHLAAVKAVGEAYPLRGEIELSDSVTGAKIERRRQGPASGEAWVEPRLLNLLGIALGDSIEVGYLNLEVTRIIINEPDRGAGFGGAGARVMIAAQDLPASKLIRPGSRATYRMLMRGSEDNIEKYKKWYAQNSKIEKAKDDSQHFRLVTPEDAEEQLGEAFSRGRSFLLLSGTIGVLLAGLAMALASHRYAGRLTDQVALMKAWGQSSGSVRRSQFVRLLVIALVATSLGMFIGWLLHSFLLELAKGVLNVELPGPSFRPWLVASITGMVCVLGFALPALWHLPSIAPLKVLRRDLPSSLVSQSRRLILGVTALFVLTTWYSDSFLMASLFLGALFLLFGVCALVALQILRLVKGFGAWQGSYVRLGLANLWRRRSQTLVQLVGFAITLMLLLIVTGVRTSLISQWEEQLPDDTPSHFLFNVADGEVDGVRQILEKNDLQTTDWYPMVRGRLVEINGEKIARERLAKSGGLSREVNLTQTAVLPESNTVIGGQWWQSAPLRSEFSMEHEVAAEIGLKLGDEVTFSIGGLTFKSTLVNLRTVSWQSMNPNFFIIFYPGALDKYSPNWVTAVKAGDLVRPEGSDLSQQAPFVNQMVQQYPTAIVLELSDVVARIRDVINRITQGLEMILLLVLACGALVLFASIGVSYDERLRENAILRTLGSSRKVILGALTVEYAALGFVSGLIASVGAEVVLYFVQTQVFELSAQWHPTLWLLGLAAGVILITALGLLRSKEIITVPPLESLRRLA